jgi:hypothetical protein
MNRDDDSPMAAHLLSVCHRADQSCFAGCIGVNTSNRGSGGGAMTVSSFNRRKTKDINIKSDFSEDLIAKALTDMTIEDRSRVYESIHGVEELNQEDDEEYIQQLMKEMKIEIQRILNGQDASGTRRTPKDALALALELKPEYVLDPKFLLRFLRSELYDPQKASRRLARNLDWKLELWGVDKLTRDIEWNDLSTEERELHKKGYGQRLPVRDRAGREVWVYMQMNQKNPDDMASFGRLLFYTGTPVEESEKPGIVMVSFFMEGFNWDRFNPEEIKMHPRISEDLPYRCVCVHQCYIDKQNPSVAKTVQFFLSMADEETRAKVKLHQGSLTEIFYALASYGIPHETIPLTHDGKRKTKFHLEFIQMRLTHEEYKRRGMGNSLTMIELPLNSDVLLGKGVPIQSSSGNIRLQAIVDEYVDEYHAMTDRKSKTRLAMDIVTMVKKASVRFLSKESGVWIEVEDVIARDKVSHLLRSRRKRRNKATTSVWQSQNQLPVSMPISSAPSSSSKSLGDLMQPKQLLVRVNGEADAKRLKVLGNLN